MPTLLDRQGMYYNPLFIDKNNEAETHKEVVVSQGPTPHQWQSYYSTYGFLVQVTHSFSLSHICH